MARFGQPNAIVRGETDARAKGEVTDTDARLCTSGSASSGEWA